MSKAPFAIFYASNAYSTSQKIMGRQSAGKAFMQCLARTGSNGVIWGLGQGVNSAQSMINQRKADGFSGQGAAEQSSSF